ncbi:MAG: hypothetical protein IJ397_02205 [Lachnospiraceae bacterium]|nr:hypothetical protein [Lachnospiraceae bacterium]
MENNNETCVSEKRNHFKPKSKFYLIMEWVLTVVVGIITLFWVGMLLMSVVTGIEYMIQGSDIGMGWMIMASVMYLGLTLIFAIPFVAAIRDLRKYYKTKKMIESDMDSSTYNLHNSVK